MLHADKEVIKDGGEGLEGTSKVGWKWALWWLTPVILAT
jgi:hypothetical protein